MYGPNNPQYISTNGGWTDKDNAKVSDGNAATATAAPSVFPQLTATEFHLSVANGDRPVSLTLKVKRKAAVAGIKDDVVRLWSNGGIGSNMAGTSDWSTDWEEVSYVWTDPPVGISQMNADSFGVRIQAKGNGVVYIDGITLQAN